MEAEDDGGGGPGPSQVDEADGEDIRDDSGSTALEEMGYVDSSGGTGGTDGAAGTTSTLGEVKHLIPLFVLVGVALLFVMVWMV